MKQILVIHGGNSYNNYNDYLDSLKNVTPDYYKLTHPRRWKERLYDLLPDYEILYPTMPNGYNAIYSEWVIYFEKLLPLLQDDVQILGHSLGAMFLAKYFNDHTLTKPINKLILVSGGYDDESTEDLGSFKVESAKNLDKNAKEVHLIHSTDDPVVPYGELAKFQADLPNAISHVFTDRGHFLNEEFNEILDIIES